MICPVCETLNRHPLRAIFTVKINNILDEFNKFKFKSATKTVLPDLWFHFVARITEFFAQSCIAIDSKFVHIHVVHCLSFHNVFVSPHLPPVWLARPTKVEYPWLTDAFIEF
jgi:hypothetical protein